MNYRIKIAFLEGALFGFFILVLFAIAFGPLWGIICGILFGTCFGLIMESFSERQFKKFQKHPKRNSKIRKCDV